MARHIVLALVTIGLTLGVAAAQSTVDCRLQAKTDYKNCKTDCRESFQADKDGCRNCDHTFAEGCRASRAVCVAPFEDQLEACLGVCRTDLDAAKALCTPGDDACIDAAQVAAFICRDTCRENQAVRDGIKNCRTIFRGCMQQCPPAS